MIGLRPPLTDDDVAALHSGDEVAISGVIYAARDAAHRRLVAALERGEPPPFELGGAVIYYVGPTPPPPGRAIGAAGPTTSGRMDSYTPQLLVRGVRAVIGKGQRSAAVKAALVAHRAVYLAALGGAGALLSQHIVAAEVIAYDDLGPEAIWRFEVRDFPATVINDIHGGDFYESARQSFHRKERR